MTAFAVYGTLRPGGWNAGRWHGIAKHAATGHVDGYRLVHNGSYPYAIPAEGERIVVDLIVCADWASEELTLRLDQLEGYPNHYTRVEVAVVQAYGETTAWLYTPAADRLQRVMQLDPVPGNDWNSIATEPEDEDEDEDEDEEDYCDCDVPRTIIMDVCQLCARFV